MRARRATTGSGFRLFEGEQEVGYIDGGTVGFRGFATRDEAALAASAAHRALARRRATRAPSTHGPDDVLAMEQGMPAALRPPAPGASDVPGWGFEIELLPEDRIDIFAIARARVMWRALRDTGIYRRMWQFEAERLASV